jgi:RNA polymerase sigma factor (sigma-70 family)
MTELETTPAADAPTIVVLDDDQAVRVGLERLMRSAGYNVVTHGSARDFLDAPPVRGPGCLVLDLRMPGMGGLVLQREVMARGADLPIVFLTGHGSVPQSVQAMKQGAVDFLEKPARAEVLFAAVEQALASYTRNEEAQHANRVLRQRVEALTPRELDVFEQVVVGKKNRRIAESLGVTEKTVKVHRARVMQKMEAGSLAELVRMAQSLGVPEDVA